MERNERLPKVSILINFGIQKDISIEENLKVLNQTIESVLLQAYDPMEIIINSTCYFWSEYRSFAQRKQVYGEGVQYVEMPLEADYELIKQCLNGEYILLMNAGEYLTDPTYIASAVKIMITNKEIDIAFANYSLVEASDSILQDKCGLKENAFFPEGSCSKIHGQWLFFNYHTLWCSPCTTLFRQHLFFGDIGRYIRNINQYMFPWMFLESNVAFYNKVVAKCSDEFGKYNEYLTLENYSATLDYIDLGVMNALVCNYPKDDLQKWRDSVVKKYSLAVIRHAGQDMNLLIGLYEMAKKNGVAHLLHESMSEIAREFNRSTQ